MEFNIRNLIKKFDLTFPYRSMPLSLRATSSARGFVRVLFTDGISFQFL